MPKINVYLPDELAAAVREHHVPVSSVCQRALRQAVDAVSALKDGLVPDQEDAAAGGLFGRFTPRARGALRRAQEEATERGHGPADTEHVLLGVLDEGGNLALKALEVLDVEPDDLRAEIDAVLAQRAASDDRAHFTPTSKAVLALSVREALGLGHNYVGCEHVLLGLVADEDGKAGAVLRSMGVDLRATRRAVAAALAGYVHARDHVPATEPPGIEDTLSEIVARLDALERRLES
ncbi:MAG TPA: Clp protease N-terminal domain-containing protein [Acidimicrobiia bacterium]|jgi:ATP-dependent Clp protease ATP-binding subunit ClpC